MNGWMDGTEFIGQQSLGAPVDLFWKLGGGGGGGGGVTSHRCHPTSIPDDFE